MADPTYPIFMFDGLDLVIVSSLEKLQTELELVDARSGIFEIFDSGGRRIHLSTTRWKITAELSPGEPIANQEFETRLRAFLRAVDDPAADNPECQLRCLMEASRKHA